MGFELLVKGLFVDIDKARIGMIYHEFEVG